MQNTGNEQKRMLIKTYIKWFLCQALLLWLELDFICYDSYYDSWLKNILSMIRGVGVFFIVFLIPFLLVYSFVFMIMAFSRQIQKHRKRAFWIVTILSFLANNAVFWIWLFANITIEF